MIWFFDIKHPKTPETPATLKLSGQHHEQVEWAHCSSRFTDYNGLQNGTDPKGMEKIPTPCGLADGYRQVVATRSSFACFRVAKIEKENKNKATSTSCSTTIFPSQHQGVTKNPQAAPCSKLLRFQREQHSQDRHCHRWDQNHRAAFIKIRRAAMGKKMPK